MNDDNEECDKGELNREGPYTNPDGSPDYSLEWCSTQCKKPECSNGRDQRDVGLGGTENIVDNLVDDADGGCYSRICHFNLPSVYLPGKDNENNPCLVKKPGAVAPVSPGDLKSIGSSCTDSTECAGYSTGGGTVYCISNTTGSSGMCEDVASDYSGVARLDGEILLAQAGGGGANFPICIPGVCGHMVGDEAACGGAFQPQGETCANQRLRQQCLLNTANANNHCPGGVIVPVPIGAEYQCLDGQAPNQQVMCGPAGQWFCKCPGHNPQIWQENLVQCPQQQQCGNGRPDPGEACDDGNRIDNDACTNTCEERVGGVCQGNECANGGDAACAADNGKICTLTNQLPCIQCVPPIGGQCTGRECAQGGDAACAAEGKECSLTANIPCITCIPENSCGNGEIDIVPPRVVDEGCEVTGTAGQYCMSEGMRPDDFGIFQPVHRCYASAHCSNAGGQCSWEMTADLEQCIEDAVGEQPVIARLLDMVSDPFRAQIVDPLDDGGMIPVICPTTDVKLCCQNGELIYMSRDPANRCQFTDCNTDLTACLTTENRCVRGGCQGELCVPLGSTTNTTCIHDPKNMCYASATCAWTGSACAWTQSPELLECLGDNADPTCPTDQSCLSRGACADQGGTAGNTCGAADTNVCCGGIGPDDPVEECDDGNRIDNDACGNDCRINCTTNADCPEGACVDGQCVDQCSAPVVSGNDPDPPANPSGYTYCDVNGTNICPAGANACRDNKCYSTGLGMFVDDAPCSCGDLPMLQGSVPSDFLTRLMAQQIHATFTLLP